MRCLWSKVLGSFILLALAPAFARAQTIVPASTLAFRSSGAAAPSSGWTLDRNGYVGTYITLASPGSVTVGVDASGQDSGGTNPRMKFVVDNSSAEFDVAAGLTNYQHTFSLPAGTHLLRAELNNDDAKTARSLTIQNLSVDGAAVTNSNTNATALAASNSYIENFRKGDAHLQLFGAAPGAEVHVALKQHDFNFGTAVNSAYMTSNPTPTSNAGKYQAFMKNHFTMVVPENSGKWNATEFTRDVPNMSQSDAMVAFAKANGMRFRQHNMIWGSDGGTPGWANTLMSQAAGGNATAKADLLDEINERIPYYVGDGVGADRTTDYYELDVLNEGIHEAQPMTIYGNAGMASIFNSVAAAVDAANASTKLYVNEYNVLQFGNDSYGNWFRDHGEGIEAAGGRVDGYGAQYYIRLDGTGGNAHSAARIAQILTNLSVDDKVVSLTEFGVQNNGNGSAPSQAAVATALDDTMRVVFGTPSATGFNMWGFWSSSMWSQAPHAALVDATFNLTVPGQRYEQLMSEWDTDLMLTADSSGAIDFRGFYGLYDVTIDGQTFTLDLTQGTTDYSKVVGTTADLNHDGETDGADLLAWQLGLSETPGVVGAPGDGNFDGLVDAADLALWTAYYDSLSTSAAQSIPEPLSCSMVLIAAAAATRIRRR